MSLVFNSVSGGNISLEDACGNFIISELSDRNISLEDRYWYELIIIELSSEGFLFPLADCLWCVLYNYQ